jgi:L-threonylcarbamoyladenylate synthase
MTYTAETFLAFVDPQTPATETIALAAEVILEGGLVAFPTETVYGLGANALSATAVQNIFSAKERPANDPLIVHIENVRDLERVAIVDDPRVTQLAEAFWPGALTLILKKHPDVPYEVTANQETVAVRVPSHPVARRLLDVANVPIAAPSANRFGRPSPTSAVHVLADLGGRVDVVLDGGNTPIGVESTILDLTTRIPTILRPGGVTLEQLQTILPDVMVRSLAIADGETAPAPGTLIKHYAPNTEVMLFQGDDLAKVNAHMRATAERLLAEKKRVGILLPDDEVTGFEGLRAQIVLLGQELDEVASHLFAGIRSLESAEVHVILIHAPRREGLGLAVWDRLWRAAEGRVILVN